MRKLAFSAVAALALTLVGNPIEAQANPPHQATRAITQPLFDGNYLTHQVVYSYYPAPVYSYYYEPYYGPYVGYGYGGWYRPWRGYYGGSGPRWHRWR
jgi:hypothetical protein